MEPTEADREAAKDLMRKKWIGLSDAEYENLFTQAFADRAAAVRAEERAACKQVFIAAVDAVSDNAAICSNTDDDYAHRFAQDVAEYVDALAGEGQIGRTLRRDGFAELADGLKANRSEHATSPIAKERAYVVGRFQGLVNELSENGADAELMREELLTLADQLTTTTEARDEN
jgi:hypothetical protein